MLRTWEEWPSIKQINASTERADEARRSCVELPVWMIQTPPVRSAHTADTSICSCHATLEQLDSCCKISFQTHYYSWRGGKKHFQMTSPKPQLSGHINAEIDVEMCDVWWKEEKDKDKDWSCKKGVSKPLFWELCIAFSVLSSHNHVHSWNII